MVHNLTQSIDFLPTLIELAGGTVPNSLSGHSVKPFLDGTADHFDVERPDWITSQYHGADANTGVFMVRKGDWKYLQYGHHLDDFQNYPAQLFNVENDGTEIQNVIAQNGDIAEEMEKLLKDTFDYEQTDCLAKQLDFEIFEEFWWNKYNESEVYEQMKQHYRGFDGDDWQKVVEWRQQFIESPPCWN